VPQSDPAVTVQEEGTLRAICEKVILPNIVLRDSDEEMFDDNPVEFIRRDIEGSDNDTRRRMACDLVRGLCRHFNARVTDICTQHLLALMATYNAQVTPRSS
jgi:exportin-2 (importin alpha re-exporter)